MNHAITTNPEHDYRAAMQEAAVAFLLRHRSEHLAGDDQVLENCARFLSQSLEVPAHLVQRIAELAVCEFEGMTSKRLMLLGLSPASSELKPKLLLLDTQTRQCHAIPLRVLPTRLLPSRHNPN